LQRETGRTDVKEVAAECPIRKAAGGERVRAFGKVKGTTQRRYEIWALPVKTVVVGEEAK